MTAPLLQTKLYIPPVREERVSRPRLLERLGAGLDRKLTLISAPAGFGKTTLLSEWIHSRDEANSPLRVAWLSLDRGDNDPARFLAYLIVALQKVDEHIGQGALAALQSPQPPPRAELLTALINQISAIPGGPTADSVRDLVLILDDYHLITAQPIHDDLEFLLDHLPSNLHLIVATRSDPPLHLARLRGHGQLTELRQTELRFTLDEVAQFLNQVMNLELSVDDVAALNARTEGWVAGLQMAAISMRRRRQTQNAHGVSGFVKALTGSHRFILDYLMEEVLGQQPDAIQEFLLHTSILDRLTGPLCDAIRGENQGQAILAQLEQDNLFLIPLDDERRWYRYHHLFADLLQQRLQQNRPDLVPGLHRRASQWYESQHLTDAAISHALLAGDLERAAHLIEEATEATWMRSEVTTFMSWIEALPDELIRARPRLRLYQATGLLMGGQPLDVVQTCLQAVISSEAADSVSGELALVRALIAAYQGKDQSAELAQQALDHLPPERLFLRSLAAGVLSLAYLYSGDVEVATQALQEALKISRQAGNLLNAVLALSHLAELALLQGRLYEAKGFYEQALELATDDQGHLQPIAGLALIGLGQLSYEWSQLETAEQHVRRGIELVKKAQEANAIRGYTALARIEQTRGDLEQARQAMQTAQQIALKFDAMDMDDAYVALSQAQLWIAQGNLEAAARWAEEHGWEMPVDSGQGRDDSWFHLLRELEHLVLARIRIAQGQPHQALKVLEPLLRAAETRGQTWVVIVTLVLRALALQARGDTHQALAATERALRLAEPAGLVRTFVDEGPAMAELLRHAASRGVAPGYVSRLLAAFDPSEPTAGGDSLIPTQALIDPLSERELEVLRLLSVHLSSPEIAEELIISVNTVRSHVKNIYSKLNVHGRTEAIERARELRLL